MMHTPEEMAEIWRRANTSGPPRRATCYHEAGHAVAFYLLTGGGQGLQVVVACGEWPKLYLDLEVSSALPVQASVMLVWAGAAAQSIRSKRRAMNAYLSRGDVGSLMALYDKAHFDSRALADRIREELRAPQIWCAVCGLADVLCEKGAVAGEEANSIIRLAMEQAA